jgi:hypothetical protein
MSALDAKTQRVILTHCDAFSRPVAMKRLLPAWEPLRHEAGFARRGRRMAAPACG